MNWLICNVCLHRPINGIKLYFVTSCFHLICERCTSPADSVCKKCGEKCAVIPCDSRAPEKVKMLFGDVSKRILLHKRAVEFQANKRLNLLSHFSEMDKKYKQTKDLLSGTERNATILWHKYQDSKVVLKEKENVIALLKRKIKTYEDHLSKYQILAARCPPDKGSFVDSLLGKSRLSDCSHVYTATPRAPVNLTSSVFISPESVASKVSSRSGDSTPFVNRWTLLNVDPSVISTPNVYQKTTATPRRFI